MLSVYLRSFVAQWINPLEEKRCLSSETFISIICMVFVLSFASVIWRIQICYILHTGSCFKAVENVKRRPQYDSWRLTLLMLPSNAKQNSSSAGWLSKHYFPLFHLPTPTHLVIVILRKKGPNNFGSFVAQCLSQTKFWSRKILIQKIRPAKNWVQKVWSKLG